MTTDHPLYKSNERPRPHEEASIHEEIIKNQGKLDALDAEIAKLMEQRRPLTGLLRLQRSIVSPVRCVPPEILSEIIAHAIGIYDSSISRATDSTDVKSGPIWVFGRVCRHWREVIQSSPKLWSHITLFMDRTSIRALKTILERSFNLPLTISVLMKHPVRQNQSKAINLLLDHFNRWYNVILRLPFYSKMVQIFSDKMAAASVHRDYASCTPVPTVLHSLILHHCPNGSSLDFPLDLISHFSKRGFQTIRRLVLRCDMNPIPIQSRDIDDYIPWKQLEFFDNPMLMFWPHNQPSTAENTLLMLKRMPNLTALNVHDDRRSILPQSQSISSIVTLPTVHTATFRSSGVLPALCLPALQHTVLGLMDLRKQRGNGTRVSKLPFLIGSKDHNNFMSEFSRLLTRSSPPLKSITFESLVNVEDTFDLLRLLPSSVETLEYIHYCHNDSLLCLLDGSRSSDAARPMLLPNLKELTLCASGGAIVGPSILLSCIKSRLRPYDYDSDSVVSSSGLRRVKVMYDDATKIPIGTYGRVLSLVDEGLSVSISVVKSSSVYPDLMLSDARYPW
jgi:hypothetical protein